jgi:cation transport ATPase
MKNIRQNLLLAFGYNFFAIPIAAGALYPCAAGPPAAARCLEQAVWQLRVDRRVLTGPGSAA